MTEQPSSRDVLHRLMATVVARKQSAPPRSYTAHLLEGGPSRIGAKIREEAEEFVGAASASPFDRQHAIHEAADLLYHTWVLLACCGIPLEEVESELQSRFGISGLDEKESRRL